MSDWLHPDDAPVNTKVWINDPLWGVTIGLWQGNRSLSEGSERHWIVPGPDGGKAQPNGWRPLGVELADAEVDHKSPEPWRAPQSAMVSVSVLPLPAGRGPRPR